jgi:hypothetical protein
MDGHHGRREQVAAGQRQQGARPHDPVLAEQQHRGDAVGDQQRRLVQGDERRHRRQRRLDEGHQRAEQEHGDEEDDARAQALGAAGRLVQQECRGFAGVGERAVRSAGDCIIHRGSRVWVCQE